VKVYLPIYFSNLNKSKFDAITKIAPLHRVAKLVQIYFSSCVNRITVGHLEIARTFLTDHNGSPYKFMFDQLMLLF
jgi:hypothetical protein